MPHRLAKVAIPLRILADRIALASLLFLSVVLLILSHNEAAIVTENSQRAADLVAPVLRVLNAPIVSIRETAAHFGEVLAVHQENERLREENRRLLSWQAEAVRLRIQNQSLRGLLQMPELPAGSIWTTAQIVADTGGPFVQTRLIDAGISKNVVTGMAAINQDGLVGRVVSVGENSARILLITDFNSRIPVIIENSRDRAILEGDNSGLPKLRFLPLDPDIKSGARVLTSGEGGLIPPGLLVGEIKSIANGDVRIVPFVDWTRLNYVSVLNREPILAPAVGKSVTRGPR